MSRWEFLRRLEELLSDLAPAERDEALRYYNDYIHDSGKENEEEVLKALGSPEKVAATVKEGLDDSRGEFTETGFKSDSDQSADQVAPYREPHVGQQGSEQVPPPKSKMSGGVIALIVILALLASPILIALGAALLGVAIGLLGALFGIIVAIGATIFGIVVSFGVTAITFMLVGISLIPVGIVRLFSGPLGGLALISVGLVLAGVGLLLFLVTALLILKLLPAMFKLLARFVRFIFKGRRVVQNA